jgi:hypothetical protein
MRSIVTISVSGASSPNRGYTWVKIPLRVTRSFDLQDLTG